MQSEIKERCQQRMEGIFKEKLFPMIQAQVKASLAAREAREKLDREFGLLQGKMEKASKSCRDTQAAVDRKLLLDAQVPQKSLQVLETKKAEADALEGQLELLAAEAAIAGTESEKAQGALLEALRQGLLNLRKDIEENTRTLLLESLFGLIFFEEHGSSLCEKYGVFLGINLEREFGRFVALDPILKDLEAFCSPMGVNESFLKRRTLREKFLTKVESS